MTRSVKDVLWGYRDPAYAFINKWLGTYLPPEYKIPDKVGLLIMVRYSYSNNSIRLI